MFTIFTSVKGNEANTKISLVFLENSKDFSKWIKIEDKYMKYILLSTEGNFFQKTDVKRKPLTIHDFKPLYGFWLEDINYLASLVESKVVCMKITKAKKQSIGFSLTSLHNAAKKEKFI